MIIIVLVSGLEKIKNGPDAAPNSQVPLTNESLAQFKIVMDFMNKG